MALIPVSLKELGLNPFLDFKLNRRDSARSMKPPFTAHPTYVPASAI